MMQSRHQASAVIAVEATPVYITAPVPGMAWNQPAMPNSEVRAPMQAKKGQGELGRMWKGWAMVESMCGASSEAVAMLRRAWVIILQSRTHDGVHTRKRLARAQLIPVTGTSKQPSCLDL